MPFIFSKLKNINRDVDKALIHFTTINWNASSRNLAAGKKRINTFIMLLFFSMRTHFPQAKITIRIKDF